MAIKFRRRVKVFPGVRLNLSKSGISTTIGPRGLNVNLNRHGTFLNTGIPGTGIYDRHRLSGGKAKGRPASNARRIQPYNPVPVTTQSTTPDTATSTTPGLKALLNTIEDCYEERKELLAEMQAAKKRLRFAKNLELASRILLLGFVFKWFRNRLAERESECIEIQDQLQQCAIDIDLHIDLDKGQQLDSAYTALMEAYRVLITSHRIWDTTHRSEVDRRIERSPAQESVHRKLVTWHYANLPMLRSRHDGLHFENATGADLYLYPAFMVLLERSGKLALLSLDQLKVHHSTFRFIEQEDVPTDSEVIDHVWLRANKDGSPDRRFKDNYQLPVCRYSEIQLNHPSGLEETYAFSDAKKAEAFATAFNDFLDVYASIRED